MRNKKLNPALFLLIIIITMLTSCSQKNYFTQLENSNKLIDKRLVGIWTGIESDNQIAGMTKEWKMTRYKDGKFILEFKSTIYGNVHTDIEKGNWWIQDGQFYESHNVSGETDIYKYEIIDKNKIKFIAKSISMPYDNQEYVFIDTRFQPNRSVVFYDKITKANLIGCWTDSREGNIKKSGIRIYRPCDFKSFPPSRYRFIMNLNKDNSCSWLSLSPSDRHHMKDGTWDFDQEKKTLLIFNANNKTDRSFIINAIGENILKIKSN